MKKINRSRAQKREYKKRLKKRAKDKKTNKDKASSANQSLTNETANHIVDMLNFCSNIPEELEIAKSGFKQYNKFNLIEISLFVMLLLSIDRDKFKNNGFYLTNTEISDELDWNPFHISLMLGSMKSIGAIKVQYEPGVNENSSNYNRRISLTENFNGFLKQQYNIGTTYESYIEYWYTIKESPLDFDNDNLFFN